VHFFSYDEQAQDRSAIWLGVAFTEHHIFSPMQLRPDLHSKAKPPCQSIPAHTPGFQHPQLEMQEPLLIYRKTWAMYQAVACQRCRGFVCPVSIQEETAYTSRDGFARIGKHLSG